MDDTLSTEAIKANIEYFKKLKEEYSSMYSQALLNQVKFEKMLHDLEDQE